MKKSQRNQLICFILLGFSSILVHQAVFAANVTDIPSIEDCRQVTMRDSGGWWLSIYDDGSATYGFGVLPAQIRVKPQTFSFEDIYRQARKLIEQPEDSSSTRYLAVSFYRFGESSAIEHRSKPFTKPLIKLFKKARQYSIPPQHEFDRLAHERINSFWSKSPPVSP